MAIPTSPSSSLSTVSSTELSVLNEKIMLDKSSASTVRVAGELVKR